MDLNLLTALAAWAAVAATLVTVSVQIKESKKLTLQQQQHAKELTSYQLFLQLFAQYDSEYMQRKRALLSQQLLRDATASDIDDVVLVFFETLGFMTNRGILDKEIVWNSFSYDVLHYWCATSHYVTLVRESMKDRFLFREFEQMKLSFDKMQSPDSQLTRESDATVTFLNWEVRRLVRQAIQDAKPDLVYS